MASFDELRLLLDQVSHLGIVADQAEELGADPLAIDVLRSAPESAYQLQLCRADRYMRGLTPWEVPVAIALDVLHQWACAKCGVVAYPMPRPIKRQRY